MARTPYKNALFVTYAVKAAFEKDPTVPPSIVAAVQYAIEDFTQKQAQALQPVTPENAPAPRGGGTLNESPRAPEDHAWKQRLAEAIDIVMQQEQAEAATAPGGGGSSLGGGGDEEEDHAHAPVEEKAAAVPAEIVEIEKAPRRKQRFSAEEVRYLKAGVEIHGEGQWAKMIQDSRLKFAACRTAVSLKDKWRNMGASQKKV